MNKKFEEDHPRLRKFREFVDTRIFWTSVAFLILSIMVVYSVGLYAAYHNSNKALTTSQKQEAINIAQDRAGHVNEVNACLTSVKNQPVLDAFFKAQRAIIDNSIITTQASLVLTPANDPLNDVRAQSLTRLYTARTASDNLRDLLNKQRKTKAVCLSLSIKYGITK